MKKSILLNCLIILSLNLTAQTGTETISGQVSFLSSKNVYVKFKSTAGIIVGDTLFLNSKQGPVPALIVNNLSSYSCVCSSISTLNISVADLVIARTKTPVVKTEKLVTEKPEKETPEKVSAIKDITRIKNNGPTQQINGSISVASYSDFSNTQANNSNRFHYSLSLNVKNIADSKFSLESYISFRHKAGDWIEVKNDLFSALKIFNLAVIYDLNRSTSISLGRRINPKISNIGATDGMQIEKSFRGFSMGALAGTRPDYVNYGFDSKLIQFGGYVALSTKKSDSFSESSLAFMQQMNGSNIDRRFIYFQHSNSIIKNLYFVGTFEVDLYQLKVDSLKKETATNNFDPTGLFLSLRYKLSNKLSLSASYDARKNVVYYETYKTYIDRLLENELRQGFRIQANYQIIRNLSLGIQTGYRFIKSDPHPSKNIYGYLTYSQIPGLNMSVTVSGTYLESSYMNGRIYGTNISRDLFKGKLYAGLGYQYIDYALPEGLKNIIQHVGEVNIYWQFSKKMSLSANYEGTFENPDKYHRVYLQIRKRF